MVLLQNRRDKNMRILLVEDDEALCAAVAPLLEQEGYRVDVCRDGAQRGPRAWTRRC